VGRNAAPSTVAFRLTARLIAPSAHHRRFPSLALGTGELSRTVTAFLL